MQATVFWWQQNVAVETSYDHVRS